MFFGIRVTLIKSITLKIKDHISFETKNELAGDKVTATLNWQNYETFTSTGSYSYEMKELAESKTNVDFILMLKNNLILELVDTLISKFLNFTINGMQVDIKNYSLEIANLDLSKVSRVEFTFENVHYLKYFEGADLVDIEDDIVEKIEKYM